MRNSQDTVVNGLLFRKNFITLQVLFTYRWIKNL